MISTILRRRRKGMRRQAGAGKAPPAMGRTVGMQAECKGC
jgi:hypothetical protein